MPLILLVEDDPEAGAAIAEMLSVLGHEVVWCHNGRDALARAEESPAPHAVLTDILMPGMDGIEFIQALGKREPPLPILAMSAQQEAPYLHAAHLLGAQATLGKPFNLAALQRALEGLLG